METVMDDPAFLGATLIVIDFETLTPAGRPPELIEVAAIAGRFIPSAPGRRPAVFRP